MNELNSQEKPHFVGIKMADTTRAAFNDSATAEDFCELAKQPLLTVLQCSEPVRDSVWSLVNEHFCRVRPDVYLRVYAHYQNECDLSFARLLTNVRRFSADCLMHAKNIEHIAAISNLESLHIGIFELNDFSVLNLITPKLTSLSLSATRSKKPSLAPLSRFRALEQLYIEGHNKEIEVLSELSELADVTLRSVSTPGVEYLTNLTKLWSLDIKLGGIRDFQGIEGKESIKYLELWQVRELNNIDFVSTLRGLQYLFLQSLPQIQSIPQLRNSTKLRRVVIENLKGLSDFTPFETAPALEEFALMDGRKQTPQQLLPVFNNPKVRRVSAHFVSLRKYSEFLQMRETYGKDEMNRWDTFEYR